LNGSLAIVHWQLSGIAGNEIAVEMSMGGN
jgi:hypothetical protein